MLWRNHMNNLSPQSPTYYAVDSVTHNFLKLQNSRSSYNKTILFITEVGLLKEKSHNNAIKTTAGEAVGLSALSLQAYVYCMCIRCNSNQNFQATVRRTEPRNFKLAYARTERVPKISWLSSECGRSSSFKIKFVIIKYSMLENVNINRILL